MSSNRIALIASLGTLAIVAVIVLNMTQFSQRFEEKQTAAAASLAASLDDLRRKNDDLQTRLDALTQEKTALRAALDVQQRDIQTRFSQSREEVHDLQARQYSLGNPVTDLEQLKEEVQHFKSSTVTLNQEQQALLRKLSYSVGVILHAQDRQEAVSKTKGTSVSFASYEGYEWKNSVSDYLLKLSSFSIPAPKIVDTKQGTDTYSERSAGDVLLNGIFFRSVEIFDYFNGKPNNIVVLAPGLVSLEDNALEILADKDVDKVFLDGCLKWKKAVVPKESKVIWTATDAEMKTRAVKLAKDIQVQVAPTCESDYLLIQDKNLLPAVWKNEAAVEAKEAQPLQNISAPQPNMATAASRPVEPFGGIGLGFYALDGNSLFITGVFDGTPAEKAGLKRGDRIVEIDGQTVAGMSEATAKAMMRGPVDTVVTLTYKPYGSTEAEPRSLSLKRSLIEIDPKTPIPGRVIPSQHDIESAAQDAKKAEELRPRAEKGDAAAQYRLGELYQIRGLPDVRSGLVNRDVEAAKWFLKAAERGHRQAQLKIGNLYLAGRGVKRDAVEAYFWLKIAAIPLPSKGEETIAGKRSMPIISEADELKAQQQAVSAVAEAKKLLKPEEISAIHNRIENWQPLLP